ncbi:glutamyl-tRNA synthetase [Desulfarculus baarsii DSM 2075]|uniref:Glutamate--tRNA ligase n=1 Tax=Desulfarculus baarsii (strain ATCC 33931 / DSM 2075 / LMG 7858 / VKM B-1802 / 2st14) TaxID=644282 RepID=E1QDG1_DESB2|nr:glutamate--tRNA ligase [Desulfarculus baarsii]ADK83480.1 glutamyl-tRNA synthetase [Desulfarculus baarsii DSM 2075]
MTQNNDNRPKVRTRFPPSPTGALHIGGGRTALFNWLFARHHGGQFIMRLEDTDLQRSKPEHVTSILEAMEWLGLDFDEGPYYQTKRFDRYKQVVEQMLQSGAAYWCHCSPETLQAKREAAMASGAKPMYDGCCRGKGLGPAPGAVVRFAGPRTGSTTFNDMVKGPITFDHAELDDLIIQRSDGSPTYHLAVIVDDIDMEVTHVIRGDDHVSNTPRQILLIRALGHLEPRYAHIPMILGQDKARLSKRHGATAITDYREMGYLPEAMINALARLGWSHGDQEIFSRQELIELFDLDSVGRSAAVFDLDKLRSLNHKYIQKADPQRLAQLVQPFLAKLGLAAYDEAVLRKAIPELVQRTENLEQLAQWAQPYLVDQPEMDAKARQKFLIGPEAAAILRQVRELVAAGNVDDVAAMNEAFRALAARTGQKLGALAQPTRVALTGRTASPGIFEVMAILGRQAVLTRLDQAIAGA